MLKAHTPILTREENVEARILGEQILHLVTQVNPLVGGFALFAVVRSAPPLRTAFRLATMGFQAALKAGSMVNDPRH
jgi:hypothetical protein